MRILSSADVHRFLPLDLCIEAMARALVAVADGGAEQPLRQLIRVPTSGGLMGWMPGYCAFQDGTEALGEKLVSVFPVADAPGRTRHRGVVALFDPSDGRIEALVEAGALTAIRTPAASAVATDILARPAATSLAILGSGEQARGHLEAMLRVRPFRTVRVWSRRGENAHAFADREGARYDVEISAVGTVEEAVRGADVICTTTYAPEPILRRAWVSAGAHLNVIGSSVPTTSEIDVELVRDARFYTDHRETVQAQGGDYRRALAAGVIGADHIVAEVGEVLAGRHPGRESDQEITLYKSVGLAVYDLAAGQAALRAALAEGAGLEVDLEE